MLKIMHNIYRKLYRKFLGTPKRLSSEAIVWGYRLFLDREPENSAVVSEKLKSFVSTRELREEFLSSDEFKQKNGSVDSLSLSGHEPPMYIEQVPDLQELFFHIQHVWEQFGETEPYFSVWTSEKYKSSHIQNTRIDFYNTGRDQATILFRTFERNGIDYSAFRTCLEYGCGVGRVTNWLAQRFETVIGYDISRPHLQLARQYFDEIGLQNVSFCHVSKPQDIGNFPKVDVVYSLVVIQHNPPPIMRLIIRELIKALNPGGIAFFQVPTYRLDYRFSLEEYLTSEADKKDMEMHVLSQKEIFEIINEERGQLIELLEDGWPGLGVGQRSNTFVVQKKSA